MASVQPATFPPEAASAANGASQAAYDAGAANVAASQAAAANAAAAGYMQSQVVPSSYYPPQEYYNYYAYPLDQAGGMAQTVQQDPAETRHLFGWLEVPRFDMSDIFWTGLLALYILPFYALLIAPYIQWGLGYIRYLWKGDYGQPYHGPTYGNFFGPGNNGSTGTTTETPADVQKMVELSKVLEKQELDTPVKDET